MPNLWVDSRALPPGPAAALAALHLTHPRPEALERLTPNGWQAAIAYCDRARLTLPLRDAARKLMPPALGERVDADAAKNLVRVSGAADLYRSLSERLAAAGLQFVALKGLTHAPLFGMPAHNRMQYDIDLFLPGETAAEAQRQLMACGWVPLAGMEAFPTDHLPALIRQTGWQWRGDFFDTAIPLSVELHFQFWNEGIERLRAPGADQFWQRRTRRSVAGVELGVLHPADALAYAALHVLRHLLQGSVRPFHVFEIAWILDARARDRAFWDEWRSLHPPQLRLLQAVAFGLAREWFGGRAAGAVEEEIGQLPAATAAWFEEFAVSPAACEFHPNKDELFLHWSLLDSRRDRWQVARRRLLPGNLPPLASNAYIPDAELTWRRRAARWLRFLGYAAGRLRHHLMSLPRTAVSWLRWRRRLGAR